MNVKDGEGIEPNAWWTDRNDRTHIYWNGDGEGEDYSGTNATEPHGCYCGIAVS